MQAVSPCNPKIGSQGANDAGVTDINGKVRGISKLRNGKNCHMVRFRHHFSMADLTKYIFDAYLSILGAP